MLALIFIVSACDVASISPKGRTYDEALVNGRPTLVVSVPDEPKTEVEFAFKVAGERFVVGPGRLHTILEGDLIAKDELWSGFTLYGELPEIEPYTKATVPLFRSPPNYHNEVSVAVRRICSTDSVRLPCNFEDFIDSRLYRADTVSGGSLGQEFNFPGFDIFAVRRASDGSPVTYYYGVTDDIGSPREEYIECPALERVVVPHCTHHFEWKAGLSVSTRYKSSNIGKYREIKSKVIALLNQLNERKPGQSGLPTVYFPKDNFNG